MKKVFLLLAAAACLAVSCKHEEKGEVLSPEENKATLDETMTKAVQMLEVDHWQGTADLITGSAVVLQDITPDESAANWLTEATGTWYSEADGVDITTIDLEKIQGTLTVKDNTIYATEGKGLNVAYSLEDGTAVAANVTVKNSSTKLLLDEDYDYQQIPGGEDYQNVLISKEYLIVPASVDAVVTADGKQAASVKLTTDLNVANETPTPNDSFSATLAVSADKYTFSLTRAKYSPTEVAVDASIKYDKTTVVAASFEAKGKIGVDEDQDLDPLATTGKVKASFKILDNVELKGDLNWDEFKNLIGNNDNTEAAAKELAAKAEKCVNLVLYVQKTAQAKLGFEAYQPAENVWSAQPVIRFEDGSQYMLPEEFFNPENFPKTVDAVNAALAQMQEFLAGPESESEPLQ